MSKKIANEVLAIFGMEDNNVVKNPIVPGTKLHKDEGCVTIHEILSKQVVGSLVYLTIIRPHMMFGVSLISKFMVRPTMAHWFAAKRISRYLKGTINMGIFYMKQENNLKLISFTDSDYASDLDDRRNTSRFVFKLGVRAISQASKKQPVFSLPQR